jgi:hypothetical protein
MVVRHTVVSSRDVVPVNLPNALLAGRPVTPEREAAYGLLTRLLGEVGGTTIDDLVKDELGWLHCAALTGPWVSIAHSPNAVAAAVSTEGRIGIDVEVRSPYDPDVGNLVLTPRQQSSVEGSVDPEDLFLRLWTRKEAIGKALGVGIDDDVLACDAENERVALRGKLLHVTELPAPDNCRAALAVELIRP